MNGFHTRRELGVIAKIKSTTPKFSPPPEKPSYWKRLTAPFRKLGSKLMRLGW